MVRSAQKTDEICIEHFVSFLQALKHPGLQVSEWPEDTGLPNQIDAIARPYAIEHTSIDALPNQRKLEVAFRAITGNLHEATKGKLGFRLRIMLLGMAMEIGHDWSSHGQAIERWINIESRKLADGIHRDFHITGVPYSVCIVKGGPIRTDGVTFGRWFEADPKFYMRIKGTIDKKLPKLARHRTRNIKTVLLVGSDDIAIMSLDQFGLAFDQAYQVWPAELDELWFAHHVADQEINFCDMRTDQAWTFHVVNKSIETFP